MKGGKGLKSCLCGGRKDCVGEVRERGRFSSSSVLQKRKLRPRDIFCLAKLFNDSAN